MFEFLSSWQLWLAAAVVVILIIWFICNFEWKKKRQRPRHPRASREHVVTSDEITILEESTLDDSCVSMTRSFARPLAEPWQPSIPEEILNPKRPESTTKESAKETRGEKLCKEAAERIYGVTFHRTIRPAWLRNPETGRPMELDLYNEELKIAIEYNGRQHYEYVPFFHKGGVKDYDAQVRRDNYKLDICDEKGVYVIVVPYYLPEDKIEAWIRYYDPTALALREARKTQLA